MDVIIGVLLAVVGMIVSLYLGRAPLKEARTHLSRDEFLRVRRWSREHERELLEKALVEHSSLMTEESGQEMAGPGWVLPSPVDLDGVRLAISNDQTHSLPLGRAVLAYWPVEGTGRKLRSYHEAVTLYDPPGNWFNGVSYRLLRVQAVAGEGLDLTVGVMRYWDGFDSTETLTFEAARAYLKSRGRRIDGPFRRTLKDPFEFSSRNCPIGFGTLTIRVAESGPTFYLHRRDRSVAVGIDSTSLVPAGEFQPSDDSRYAIEKDLSLWKAMMREYAEEMLGVTEVRTPRGAPIDYDHEEPYASLNAGRRAGTIRPYALGLILHPLSWKALFRTVCVFDAAVFDQIFSDMPTENAEGVLELPSRHRAVSTPLSGWPFDAVTVSRYLSDPAMSAGAKQCLAQAWQYREALVSRDSSSFIISI